MCERDHTRLATCPLITNLRLKPGGLLLSVRPRQAARYSNKKIANRFGLHQVGGER